MKLNIHTKKFTVYKLNTEDQLYVAIPEEYNEVIQDAIAEYGSIEAVPSDKTVRGIFFPKEKGVPFPDENAQQNDITINQLISNKDL